MRTVYIVTGQIPESQLALLSPEVRATYRAPLREVRRTKRSADGIAQSWRDAGWIVEQSTTKQAESLDEAFFALIDQA